jgi:hypothetical protein
MSKVATESKAAAVGVIIGSTGKEVCRAFRNTSKCRFEKDCKFEHSTGEQITPPPRDYTPKGDCHNFAKEQKCRFGDRCRFLHGTDDKRSTYRPERPAKEEETTTGEKQICRNFRDRGRCRFGDKCKHLHVAGDGKKEEKKAGGQAAAADGDKKKRRRRGPKKEGKDGEAKSAPREAKATNGEKQLLKEEDKYDGEGVELCRNFRNTGRCRFGESCTYSHVAGGPIGHPAKTERAPRSPPGECYNFKENGECKFGTECRFKHGETDSREVPQRRTQRKTGGGGGSGASKPCYNFQENGSCEYGSECRFAHVKA